MSLPRLLLLLVCALLPVQGAAQAAKPEPATGTSASSPPLVPAPAAPRDTPRGEILPREWPKQKDTDSENGRMALASIGGTVFGTVLMVPGITFVVGETFNCDCKASEQVPSLIFGYGLMGLGAATGSLLGIMGAGALMDGEGRAGPTFAGVALGALLGAAVGGPMLFVMGPASLVFVIAGPIIGGILAYEGSHDEAIAKKQRLTRAGVRVMPVVSTTRSGGLLGGLAGSF